MVTTPIVQAHAAGIRIRLDAAGTGLLVNPATAMTPALRQLVATHKPVLVTTLAAERDHRCEMAELLRTLRRLRSATAPSGVTLELNATWEIVAKPSRQAIPPEQQATILALREPLHAYLLQRQLFAVADVNLRAEASRRLVKRWDAAGHSPEGAPFLRTDKPFARLVTHCVSCGEPLAHDPGWEGSLRPSAAAYGRLTRCTDCRAAVALVLPLGRSETLCWCGAEVHRYQADGVPVCEVHDDQAYCPRCFVRPIASDCWVTGNGNRRLHRACGQCGQNERGVA